MELSRELHRVPVHAWEKPNAFLGKVDIPGSLHHSEQLPYRYITSLFFSVLRNGNHDNAPGAFRIYVLIHDWFAIRFTGVSIWKHDPNHAHVQIGIRDFIMMMSDKGCWSSTRAEVRHLERGEPFVVLHTPEGVFLLKCIVSSSYIDAEFDPSDYYGA